MVKPNDPLAIYRKRVVHGTSHECWSFIGHHNKQGYPIVSLNGKTRKASHVVLEAMGRPRPKPHSLALHSCDNPRCVNPAHLRWGSHKENMKDRIERTGYNMPRGWDTHNFVRTPDIVEAILRLTHLTAREVAEATGVSKPTVLRVWAENSVAVRRCGPPSKAQERVLNFLKASGTEWVGTPIMRIADELGMHHPNVHRALHELLKRGIIEKRSPRPRAISEWKVRVT